MDGRDDHLQYLQSTRQKHCRNWMLMASYQWSHQGWCDTLWSANGSLVVWSSLESHRQIGRRYQLVNLGFPIEFITTRFPNYQWPLSEPRTWHFLWTFSTARDKTKPQGKIKLWQQKYGEEAKKTSKINATTYKESATIHSQIFKKKLQVAVRHQLRFKKSWLIGRGFHNG